MARCRVGHCSRNYVARCGMDRRVLQSFIFFNDTIYYKLFYYLSIATTKLKFLSFNFAATALRELRRY